MHIALNMKLNLLDNTGRKKVNFIWNQASI
jgi:hypothetical protein